MFTTKLSFRTILPSTFHVFCREPHSKRLLFSATWITLFNLFKLVLKTLSSYHFDFQVEGAP